MSNKNKINKYEVTPLTMAILSDESEDGTLHTYIMEEIREYAVKATPTKVIDDACRFFGSTLEGRLDGTRDISNITHKAPITIDPSSGLYFFPTASPKNKKCSWIAHSHVEFLIPMHQDKKTQIIFKNGKNVMVNVSYGSMLNQIQRTAQFRYSLDSRMGMIQSVNRKRNKEEE